MLRDDFPVSPLTHRGLAARIDLYLTVFPTEVSRVQAIRAFLDTGSDLSHRSNMLGHVTASGYVIHEGKVLLIRHRSLGRWLQPGGHIDAGETVESAALREVLEETGIPCRLHPWHGAHGVPLDIDSHAIPANDKKGEGAHLHHDIRYLLVPDHIVVARDETETSDASWIAFDDVPKLVDDINLINTIARCRQIVSQT